MITRIYNADGSKRVVSLNVSTLQRIGMTTEEAELFIELWRDKCKPPETLASIESFFNNSFARFDFEFVSQINGHWEFMVYMKDDQLDLGR